MHPVHWWKTNEAELPHWSSAARIVLLLQPSSAASEKVFSIPTTLFGHLQDIALQDYIECSGDRRQGLVRTLKVVDVDFEEVEFFRKRDIKSMGTLTFKHIEV